MPGLGPVLGARVLGEFGDDPERFASAKSRRNYAGTSPLTIASGRKRTVTARHVRNRRLYVVSSRSASRLRTSGNCRACTKPDPTSSGRAPLRRLRKASKGGERLYEPMGTGWQNHDDALPRARDRDVEQPGAFLERLALAPEVVVW